MASSSALQKQLSLLRTVAPQNRHDKRNLPVGTLGVEVVSFMFDLDTARTLSIDDCFELACDGLGELETHDARFREYKSNLFSSSGKELNRQHQSKHLNENLDQTLDRFLCLLCPYFLLKPAHKVIEYLVRRFKIHDYNADSVMKCILPYHETLLFARFVQLLRITDTRWDWLNSVQQTGLPLPRDVLVTHCCNHISTLEFICEMTKQAIKHNTSCTALVLFHNSVLAAFVKLLNRFPPQKQGLVLQRVSPYILNSIRSFEERDYQMGGYSALKELFSHTSLSDELNQICIERLAKNIAFLDQKSTTRSASLSLVTPESMREPLTCLAHLFQTQSVDAISPKIAHILTSSEHVVTCLLDCLCLVSEKHDTSKFLRVLMMALVELALDQYATCSRWLDKLLKKIPGDLVQNHVEHVSALILERFIKLQESCNTEIPGSMKQIIHKFDIRFPDEIDTGASKYVQRFSQEDERHRSLVLAFVEQTCGSRSMHKQEGGDSNDRNDNQNAQTEEISVPHISPSDAPNEIDDEANDVEMDSTDSTSTPDLNDISHITLAAFQQAPETDQSHLFERICSALFGTPHKLSPQGVLGEFELLHLISVLVEITEPSSGTMENRLCNYIRQYLNFDKIVKKFIEASSVSPQIRVKAVLLFANISAACPISKSAYFRRTVTALGHLLRHADSNVLLDIKQSISRIVPATIKSGAASAFDIVMWFLSSVDRTVQTQLWCDMCIALVEAISLKHKEPEDQFDDCMLFGVLMVLLTLHVENLSSTDDTTDLTTLYSLCSRLLLSFNVPIQINAMARVIHVLNDIEEMQQKDTVRSSKQCKAISSRLFYDFCSKSKTPSTQQRQSPSLTAAGLEVLTMHITSRDFLKDMVVGQRTDLTVKPMNQQQLLQLSEDVLILVSTASKKSTQEAVMIEEKGHILFEAVHSLLSASELLKAARTLMQNPDIRLRCKAVELLHNKITIEHINTRKFAQDILSMLPDIQNFIQADEQPTTDEDNEEAAMLQQRSVVLAGVLARQYYSSYSDDIGSLVDPLLSCMRRFQSASVSAHSQVRRHIAASAALSLVTICCCLPELEDVQDHLHKIIPCLLSLVQSKDDSEEIGHLTHETVLSSLQALVLHVPQLLTPHLSDIVRTLLLDAQRAAGYSDKVKEILEYFATYCALDVWLPALFKAFDLSLHHSHKAVHLFFDTLMRTIDVAPTELMQQHSVRVLKFYLHQALEMRRLPAIPAKIVEHIDEIEQQSAVVLVRMCLKLSEQQFKSFFLKILEWAEIPTEPEDFARSITFFTVANALARRFKTVFVSYLAYILQQCSVELERCVLPVESPSSRKSRSIRDDANHLPKHKLSNLVLSTLRHCFEHDTQGFMAGQKRVAAILPALANQLQNTGLNKAGQYEFLDRTERFVIPCIIQLAKAVSPSDVHWKSINQAVIQASRHPSAVVRFCALKCLQGFYRELGQSFAIMLPETMPAIAELMEDDDTRVEQLVHQFASELESLTGEPISHLLAQ